MQIMNTLSGKKEELIPLNPPRVTIYACGPTVYNYIHLGNARPIVVFDTLRRYLKYRGYEVTYVQNFTDIDDKIINRANEEGMEPMALAEKYIGEYFQDADAVGVLRADVHPRVSQNIPEIIALVQKLIDTGHAYELEGDVYYRVRSFKSYGKLSGRDLDDMKAGARIGVDERKEDAFDFALWKKSKPGEPAWDSPWGGGRPGWHIECSAMSMKYLGETLDIHGGGADLIFPHHENEIAQSEAATGKPFANYWMHNGFITVNHEKMSKSLGNFFILRDILEQFPGDVVRFYLISTHYRNPLDFDDTKLQESRQALARLKNTLKLVADYAEGAPEEAPETETTAALQEQLAAIQQQFNAAMDDDMNTPNAIGALFEMAKVLNKTFIQASQSDLPLKKAAAGALALYQTLGDVLGIFMDNTAGAAADQEKIQQLLAMFERLLARPEIAANDELQQRMQNCLHDLNLTLQDGKITPSGVTTPEAIVQKMIENRSFCRQCKQYAMADCVRDELKGCGIILEDTREGVRWKFADE